MTGSGVRATVEIDGPAVMQRLHTVRDAFIDGVKAEIAKLPDEVKHAARARFDGPTILALDDGTTVSAKAVVIATGAKPRLGVEVAVFDEGDTLAAIDDEQIADSLHRALEAEFPIHLGVELTAEADGKGVLLRWTGASQGEARFERILAAAGRPPVLDDLGLDTTGLALDEHGAPKVDPTTMQCEDKPIFMAGDAEHPRPVLHEAQAEGAIAGRNAASFPKVEPGTRMTLLSIIFTQPGVATVGQLPNDSDSASGTIDYADQGRAKVFATNMGLGKLHADAKDGRLLHAVLVGPAVEHAGHLLAWAIEQRLTADRQLAMPFYHPTYEEALQPALRAICKAVGTSPGDDHDGGFMPGS